MGQNEQNINDAQSPEHINISIPQTKTMTHLLSCKPLLSPQIGYANNGHVFVSECFCTHKLFPLEGKLVLSQIRPIVDVNESVSLSTSEASPLEMLFKKRSALI